MNVAKQQYLHAIRSDSAYPVYRAVINTIALLGFVLAGVIALGAVIGGFSAMSLSFMTGLGTLIVGGIFAAIVFMTAKLSKEAALILADLADSTVDANSRSRAETA